jgi:hypothetical protein
VGAFQKQWLTFEHKNRSGHGLLQGIFCLSRPLGKLFLHRSSKNALMKHDSRTNRPQPADDIGQPVQTSTLTAYIFEYIRQQIPGEKNLAKVLVEVLNVGESAVYKKLKVINPLTLEEAALLARHFHISLDNFLLPQAAVVPMAFYPLAGQVAGPLDFLRRLSAQVEQAANLPGARLYYATTEIPIFHYLHFPELTAFKLFTWGRTTWELDEHGADIRPEELTKDAEMNRLREQILAGYNRLNCIEFWPLHMLDNTLNQIQYFREEGVFSDQGFHVRLFEQISQLLAHQQEMAKHGQKHLLKQSPGKDAGEFWLYHNEIAHTNNTFLLRSQVLSAAYFTFDNPNFVQTFDPAFVAYTQHWFDRLQKRSTSLTRGAERQRLRFFSLLEHRMERALQNGPALQEVE